MARFDTEQRSLTPIPQNGHWEALIRVLKQHSQTPNQHIAGIQEFPNPTIIGASLCPLIKYSFRDCIFNISHARASSLSGSVAACEEQLYFDFTDPPTVRKQCICCRLREISRLHLPPDWTMTGGNGRHFEPLKRHPHHEKQGIISPGAPIAGKS